MKHTIELGQLLLIGVSGPSLNRQEKKFLKEIAPAGVIYFRRNVENPKQLWSLTKEIRSVLPSHCPPLIGIDQEGGRVYRLEAPFTVFPGNHFLGNYFARSGKIDLVKAQARAMAQELKSIGVNLNFTPVADVNSNPRNPIIGQRSFGSDPRLVSKLVATTIQVYRQEKVISCAKHFPGHGDTFSDSHKVLPLVRASRATLLRREIPPFRAAIRAGVPAIMTAHVIYPAFDKLHPATLSPFFLKKFLRKTLRFEGVIQSDDLEMNAIAMHGSISEAAVAALGAGVDQLLVCKSLDEARAIHERIVKALRQKELDPKELLQSSVRIARMKKNHVERMAPSRKSFSWPKHQRLADKIRSLGGL